MCRLAKTDSIVCMTFDKLIDIRWISVKNLISMFLDILLAGNVKEKLEKR